MISVCIPTYNAAAYIGETLESLTRQTYTDFEVIISDNASTDGTKDVVESFFRRFPRIRYYRNESNIGYTANVAKAVQYASFDYVAIFHSDDIYLPDILKREINFLETFPDVAGVFCRARYFRGDKKSREENHLPNGLKELVQFNQSHVAFIGGKIGFEKALLRFGDFFVCPSFMTRKSLFLEMGGFADEYPTGEDLHLWIRILDAGYNLAILDQALMLYRISESQGASALRKHIHLSPQFHILDDLVVRDQCVSAEDISQYNKRKAKDLLSAAVNAYVNKKHPIAFANIDLSKKIYRFRGFGVYSLTQKIPHVMLPLASARSVLRNRTQNRLWF